MLFEAALHQFITNKNTLIKPKRGGLNDTFMLIFGGYDDELLRFFLKTFKGNILYISPKALNLGYRDDIPRNTLVIFELLSMEPPFG